jgi:hypothetical protein
MERRRTDLLGGLLGALGRHFSVGCHLGWLYQAADVLFRSATFGSKNDVRRRVGIRDFFFPDTASSVGFAGVGETWNRGRGRGRGRGVVVVVVALGKKVAQKG